MCPAPGDQLRPRRPRRNRRFAPDLSSPTSCPISTATASGAFSRRKASTATDQPPPSSRRGDKAPSGTTTSASRRFRLRKAPEHVDIKHLSKLQAADGERRKRFLCVAIDRRSRSVHLAVVPKRAAFAAEDDETERNAIAFLREAAAASPFRLTHVLTDNGNCFTPAFAKACIVLGAEHRHTRPYTPQTNGMVERDPRPGRQRGARRHHPLAPRPGAAPVGLQRSLQ